MNRLRTAILAATLIMALSAFSSVVAQAQGNYVPMDPSTLPQVPGCAWYPNPDYAGLYDAWCGSDALGWYQPYEWYQLTGIYPPDYGMGGG